MLIGFGAVCSGCPVPALCGRINRANLSVWVLPGPFPHRGNAHPVRFKTGIIICYGDMVLVVIAQLVLCHSVLAFGVALHSLEY
jgi:hypothetical protein